jgi:antitoxin component YwqK of YwqJK toxin-antitoxin module
MRVMVKISLSFLLFQLFSCSIFAQDTLTIYYDKAWNEIPFSNGASFYRKAFEDKSLWSVNDFYASNKLQMTGSYKSKKFKEKEGLFVYYYENGNKSSEGNYVAGKSEGVWKFWFESGELKSEGEYLDNEKDGVWNYWYQNGEQKVKEIYKKGSITFGEVYHMNGKLSCKGNYSNGVEMGIWTYWNSDERIILKGNFRNGKRDGEWIRTFREGEMKIHYNNGFCNMPPLGGIFKIE